MVQTFSVNVFQIKVSCKMNVFKKQCSKDNLLHNLVETFSTKFTEAVLPLLMIKNKKKRFIGFWLFLTIEFINSYLLLLKLVFAILEKVWRKLTMKIFHMKKKSWKPRLCFCNRKNIMQLRLTVTRTSESSKWRNLDDWNDKETFYW